MNPDLHSLREPDARSRRFPNIFEFFFFAIGVAGLNAVVCAALMLRWYGPVVIVFAMVLIAAASGFIAVITLPLAWLLNRLVHRRAFGITCGVSALALLTMTVLISKQPAAASLFEQEFGFPAGDAVAELDGFTSQRELQDPTVGLRFRTDAATVDQIVKSLGLEGGTRYNQSYGPLLDVSHEINPIPSWFNPDELKSPRAWSLPSGVKHASYHLYHEPETGLTYFIAYYL